ncbi:efflux RND transporter periplasmic adaptor subunit (plasmid) [Legionella lytica]|uniref:Efflux RND transporter periplasmic adaptor subunit n=1 Tax=Legionella lytica TaxID=96232 RepID=A0ABY4YDD5_9GAMM|nr:efflux RND transporter periplasmic adaptor subunit [Legionella lytica]USQ15428.1 efflux RND transporter periplasmic adaptor subunit [Legionella lytica]
MNWFVSLISFLQIAIFLLGMSSLGVCAETTHGLEDGHHEEAIERGPLGGRLFKEGDLALELLIFERGMPPHFRAYFYKNGETILPPESDLSIQLTRFSGKKEQINFISIGDFLQSKQVIEEPHSFEVTIRFNYSGKQLNWHYATYEGRVKIVPSMLKAAGIQTAVAQQQVIRTQLNVVGKIATNRDTTAPIYARYSGIIKSMTKNLGDEVTKGDLLAIVESNESLQSYEIKAPITGTIVQKHATNGEFAQNTKPIYQIANLGNVWADFTLYRKEASLVKPGMAVIVTGDEGKPKSISVISYISPLGIEDSQTTLARTVLNNENRLWLPGMYVNGAIVIREKTVPVAVPVSALQQMGKQDVVYVQQGDYFEATPVLLGEKDNEWAEVISGLDAGQHYVSKNSFYIKAEIGKEGASHED